MSITLLIPVYNRARVLRAVWPSYLAQNAFSAAVFVDDASTDETPALLRELQATSPFPIKIVTHATRMGQQASRASAIAQVKTPWVLFGEDDVWLTPGYAWTLLQQAEATGAAAIAGRIINFKVGDTLDPNELSDAFSTTSTAPVFDVRALTQACETKVPNPIEAPFLHTIALIQSAVFADVSFDKGYLGNGLREETDFYLSLNALGRRVMFSGDALCYHLRGPICGAGGHRINRLAYEYWSLRNTWRLIHKHRLLLKNRYQVAGVPLGMFLAWVWARETYQLRRAFKGEFSSFK